MTPLLGALAVIIAAAITGYVTWMIAKRSSSGAIDTSEAAKLWDEGTGMRQELRKEVIELKAQLITAIAAITALNHEITSSRQETEAAREETRKSRAETRVLMAQIEALHAETTNVLDEVKTSNALTIGALADNTESRRILEIPSRDRTDQEKMHLDTASDRIPDDKRASQNGDHDE